MINVGIVGSSFSFGDASHPVNNIPHTRLIVDILKEKNSKNINFYSQAVGGRGSEIYLSSITFLKYMYDINILLVEIVEDREECNIQIPPKDKKIFKTLESYSNIEDFLNLYKKYPLSLRNHIGTKILHEDEDYLKEQRKEIVMLSVSNIFETKILCKLLNIKPIFWSYFVNPNVLNILKKCKFNFEKFDNFDIVYERYFKKHNGKHEYFIYDDGLHLNDKENEELCEDFFLPLIYKYANL